MKELYNPFQPTLTETGLKEFCLSLESRSVCNLLKGIVHSYLQITASRPTPYPVIPDGTQSIFFSANGSFIGGAQSQAKDIQLPQAGEYFGVRFYPGALRYFFNLDLSEITNQFVDSQFLCNDSLQLHHHIYAHQDFFSRTQVCEQWLLNIFKQRDINKFDHALALINLSSGNIKIHHLAANVGWSSRHLNRLFQLHTGLTTKKFAQIIRIQFACKQLCLAHENSVTTALESGFFDQPHFLSNFKKHLLANPNEFFNRFSLRQKDFHFN